MAKKKYYQRPDGLFEAIRVIRGKRIAFRGHSPREVEQKMMEYNADLELGRPFPAIAKEWQAKHDPQIVESSRLTYNTIVCRLIQAFPARVGEISPMDIQCYVDAMEDRGLSRKSVEKEISVIKMIFAHAVLYKDIQISPAAAIKKSRGLPKKKRKPLTEEQEETVKKYWNSAPFGLFSLFLLYTGMRRGEALAITYQDIDRAAGVIHVTKKLNYFGHYRPELEQFTKSENGIRDVPLLPPLAAALPLGHIGPLFPGKDGGWMTAWELQQGWKSYCRTVGFCQVTTSDQGEEMEEFPITPHCFRHSFATICYEAGLDPRQAAEILGDSPEVLERVYTHLRERKRMTAAEKLAAHFEQVG